MLSVCVPVYNFNISELIIELSRQKEVISDQIEIICIDDFSEDKSREQNKKVCEGRGTLWVELSENIGRAAIRNLFLQYCRYDYLLFLDCDSKIIDSDFLLKYIEKLKISKNKIIYGGRIYSKERPNRTRRLRWKYGLMRESKLPEERMIRPYLSFQSNNFIIDRDLFKKNLFDESIRNYGHEDTLFAFTLKRNNLKIEHIYNPVLNGELESNKVFIEKTRLAINNLQLLNSILPDSIFKSIHLIQYYDNHYFLVKLISKFNFFLIPFLEFLFIKNIFLSVRLFSFYKLLYFSSTQNKK